MAQIIKHKRGNLEGLKNATTRAGELLVVTGSTGLGTIANGADLVFVGIDGSTASPVNKILQGTTVPNLTGGDYNTHVDGIPFFDTNDEKLFILNKGGNVEVKATPQTGGTGIVSGSAQVVLQSANKTGFTGASSITTLGTIATGVWNGTAIANANLANDGITIDGVDVSLGESVSTLQLGTSGTTALAGNTALLALGSTNSTALAGNTTTITSAQITKLSNITATQAVDLDTMESNIATNNSKATNVTTDLTITGTTGARTIVSSDGTNAVIPIATTSVAGVMSKAIFDEHVINNAKVTATSANVVSALSNQATDFGSGRISGELIGDLAGTSTLTGSFVGNGAGLTGLATNLTVDTNGASQTVDLIADDLQFLGTANEINTAVTKDGNDVKVTFSLPDDITVGGDLVVTGDMQVSGTTTTVNSTTVQIQDNILELNGAGAANGGLHIKDATGSGNVTGSIIYDTSNDVWKAGQKDAEIEIANISGAQTFTNKTINASQLINASVANGKLANSSITIDGSAISLGGSVTTLQLGTSSSTALAGNTALLALGTTNSTALAGNTTTISGGQASAITANTEKVGITTTQRDAIVANTAKTGISSAQASAITANTSKVTFPGLGTSSSTALAGDTTVISSGQASAITANTAKNTNVATNLTITGTTGARTIVSSDGTNAIIPIATTSVAGVMSKAIFDEHVVNNAKTGITTSQRDAIVANTAKTGITTVQRDAIVANTAKVTANSANVVSALSNQATDFGSGRVSGDNFGDVAGSSTITGSFVGDGSALTGLVTGLTISADNGSDDTIALTSGKLTVEGTANEIETTVSNDKIVVGIVTNPTLTGNVTVTGNLNVEGTTTTIDSTQVNIGDRVLELNYARGAGDAGLLVTDVDGSSTVSGSLVWDASSDYWMAGKLGSEKEIALLNAAPTANRVLKANAAGLLVDSVLSDDGTDATFSGDITVTGLAAGSNGAFLYADANEKLQAVDASTAGDIIQWNGSSFVASNPIDGGTF